MVNIQSRTPSQIPVSIPDSLVHPFEQMLDFKTFTSLRRMVSHQNDKHLVRRADFVQQLTLYLPEAAARIEESDFGVVHLEVGAMKLATREAIIQRDFTTVHRHFFLIADLLEHADAELADAIRISYLEALFLDEKDSAYAKARCMLSRPLENALRQSELRLKKMRATLG
jgi:hypothetical protein